MQKVSSQFDIQSTDFVPSAKKSKAKAKPKKEKVLKSTEKEAAAESKD
jgi:hypothetical protein